MRFLSAAVVVAVLFAGLGVLWVEDLRGGSEHKFMRLPDRTDNNPYSNAVLVGDTLYLAGDIGIDPETGAPPPKIEPTNTPISPGIVTSLKAPTAHTATAAIAVPSP